MTIVTFLVCNEPVKYLGQGSVTEVVERFKNKFGDSQIVDVEESQ